LPGAVAQPGGTARLQPLEALLAQCGPGVGARGGGQRRLLRLAQLGILRVALEVSLELGRIGGVGRAPDQGLAPGAPGFLAHFGIAHQGLEAADAILPRRGLEGLGLGEAEARAGGGAGAFGQALQPTPALRAARLGPGEDGEVFLLEGRWRAGRAEDLPVARGGFLGAAIARQSAGFLDGVAVDAGGAHGGLGLAALLLGGARLAQTGGDGGGAGAVAARRLDPGGHGQRLGVARLRRQRALDGRGGEVKPLHREPALGLTDQDIHRSRSRGRRSGGLGPQRLRLCGGRDQGYSPE
jgi:hypothetical protein